MTFKDRTDAGRQLAQLLETYKGTDAIVLAIPRGGVVVGYEIAKALGLPMDVVVPRKIGAPGQPEYGIGAVAGEDISVLDDKAIGYLHVPSEYIKRESERQRAEIVRRTAAYRGNRPHVDLRRRTVIIVDDGVATGYTTRAAIEEVRRQSPAELILAVPVGPPDVISSLRSIVDDVVTIDTPLPFYAVGAWYEEFLQVSDSEVERLMECNP